MSNESVNIPKEIRLLQHLRNNSREKLTSISKKTNIPISTLFDTLRELQNTFITKNTVLLNFEKLGFHTRAHIFLSVDKASKDRLQKHLLCNPKINSVFRTNNGWDFIIEAITRNNKELDQLIEQIHQQFEIEKKKIHYLIEDIKREEFKANSTFGKFPKYLQERI